MKPPRAITIALFAMGGEGGGVLADWLVDLGEANGYVAQTTSVPGVAQRTGATVYYIELFPQSQVPAGAHPVLALAPVPGEVDIVLASELMEAARALQRGLVTADRTVLVASTHRVYSMTERTAMGDGRVDADKILAGAKAGARTLVAGDFGALADQAGTPIGPALFGALAASGALPFTREQCEDAIRRGGVGVAASLKAFAAGMALAQQGAAAAVQPAVPLTPLGDKLRALAARIASDFPLSAHATLRAGVLRLADYQDVAYAADYLDRLAPLRAAAPELLDETARHLALWMSYEDTIRVADLKTRRSRFERVAGEVKLDAAQQLEIREFMHPRLEEIADTLPAALGRWLLATPWARGFVGRFTRRGRVVTTSSLGGYLLLYGIAALRPLRRSSLRFHTEQQRIGDWLACIARLEPLRPDLALEVARAQRLVKGYGDTHARGWGNFQRLMAVLPQLETRPDGAGQLRALGQAALADDSGAALDQLLAA
ncbi:MAG: putative indolepyruvate ferredoxin beta subunit oxidoreductase protein [Ramlibacter sp.]|nr:putative indolepyruvate ferredoxin beta subunit oxidoreductase protein [Ramlibacter sp.]MDB5914858.1 putative indolepyruvate ferredoxin beta subunit oxidoreductase protein [Ramlibacter sp.]